MNDKHFIWIVPLLLIIGFIVGYISGLNIPKDITIGMSKETIEAYNNFNSDCFIDLEQCNANLNARYDEVVRCRESYMNLYTDYINNKGECRENFRS